MSIKHRLIILVLCCICNLSYLDAHSQSIDSITVYGIEPSVFTDMQISKELLLKQTEFIIDCKINKKRLIKRLQKSLDSEFLDFSKQDCTIFDDSFDHRMIIAFFSKGERVEIIIGMNSIIKGCEVVNFKLKKINWLLSKCSKYCEQCPLDDFETMD